MDVLLDNNERQSAQNRLERHLVLGGRCSPGPAAAMATSLSWLRPDLVAEEFKNHIFDSDYHESFACVIDAIVRPGKDGAAPPGMMRDRVRHWLNAKKNIGGESGSGYALVGGLGPGDNEGPYVLKAPKRNDELAHEAAVGLLVTNSLRRYIPTFMYIYSAFTCSPPALKRRGEELITWCSGSSLAPPRAPPGRGQPPSPPPAKEVTYVVTERVVSSGGPVTAAYDYCKTCTGAEFLDIYLQVLSGLICAWKIAGYTHYDLHGDNVLIRVGTSGAIPYYGPGGGTLNARNVATVIDFGYNRYVRDGVSFGVYNLEFAGISASEGFPLYDAYKFLCSVGFAALRGPAFATMEQVFSYFGEGSLRRRLGRDKGADKYYAPDKKWRPIAPEALAEHVAALAGTDLLSRSPPMPPRRVGLPPRYFGGAPRDLYEYCDAEGGDFDVGGMFDESIPPTMDNLRDLRSLLEGDIPNISVAPTPRKLNNYLGVLETVLLAKDILEEGSSWARAADCAIKRAHDGQKNVEGYNGIIREIKQILATRWAEYDDKLMRIRVNDRYLRSPAIKDHIDEFFLEEFQKRHNVLMSAL